MSAQVTQSECDTPIYVQCAKMWEDVGEGVHALTVYAIVPNVRLFVLCSMDGVEHIHRQTCKTTAYKTARCMQRVYRPTPSYM